MRPTRFFAVLAACAFACAASVSAFAQSAFPPAPKVKLAVDPLRNKVYLANEEADTVTVLDAAGNTTATIPVGDRPQFIAVHPMSGRVFTSNAGTSSLSVIDGITNTNLTPTPLPLGTLGPIAINPLTNTVYIVRLTGVGTDEVTYFNANTNAWYTIATQSYQPISVAVDPIANKIYVAHYATGDVRIIDGTYNDANDHPATQSIGVWSKPFAIAPNVATGKVYGITEDPRGPIFVITGTTSPAVFPSLGSETATGPRGLAVNSVTNKAYAVFDGKVVVIDGATNALTFVPINTGTGSVAVGVNTNTNKIYIAADNGTLTVLDGATNAVATRTVPAGTNPSIGINPATNDVWVHTSSLANVEGDAGTDTNPLVTTINPLPGNTSPNGNPTITFSVTNGWSPRSMFVYDVYYQVDSRDGPWLPADGFENHTANLSGLAPGQHTIHAYAVEGQLMPLSTGPQSNPVIGRIASYTFTVQAAVTPTVSLSQSAASTTSGQSVTFTASVSGSAGTATGTIQFRDGANSIVSCDAVPMTSGGATCTTSSLGVGAHTITAHYSGNASYDAASSSSVTHTVNAPLANPTVNLAASAPTSVSGQSVTFTATVSGSAGTPTGTVQFLDGGNVIAGCAAAPLNGSGVATCTTSSLGVGGHTIGANYGGNGSYNPASASTVSHTVNAPAQPEAAVSVTSLQFGGQSMGTTSGVRQVTVTNVGEGTLTISSITVSNGQFVQENNCTTLAAGASCVIDVTFSPAVAPGGLNSETGVAGTLTVQNNGGTGNKAVSLSGTAEKSLVSHYYGSILRRAPDSSGKSFWSGEAARMAQQGADVNEAWFAMATYFFSSSEYAAFDRDAAGFVTDLYRTFFNRAPDSGGLAFWVDRIDTGMPREVVLASFLFSPEFEAFTQSIFGNTAARAEVDMVVDFYRGLLGRLPDSEGLAYWVQRFRTAQCSGAAAVNQEAATVSNLFANGAEYAGRNRTNRQFVGDLYNAYLRRGGEMDGVMHWVSQLDGNAMTRDQVRQQFMASSEFQSRVQAVVSQGCIG